MAFGNIIGGERMSSEESQEHKGKHKNNDRSRRRKKKQTNLTDRKDGPLEKDDKKSKAKKRQSRKSKSRKENKKSSLLMTAFDLVFLLIILLMVGGAAVFSVSQRADKSFYGFRFYEVLTNSMVKSKSDQKGNFTAGDMVLVKVEEAEKIQVGDIITFVPNKKATDTYLTHRVIEKEPAKADQTTDEKGQVKAVANYPTFVTQGDANNLADPPVSGDLVIGVVKVAIPKAGTMVTFVRKNVVAVLVFVVAFFGLLMIIRGYFAPE